MKLRSALTQIPQPRDMIYLDTHTLWSRALSLSLARSLALSLSLALFLVRTLSRSLARSLSLACSVCIAQVEEQEQITRQCNEAFLDADRIKDKELLRLRRIREISGM